jgi:hypothetical protein
MKLYTEIETDTKEKKYMEATISLAFLEKYIEMGWKEVRRITNACGTFITVQREIRGKL